MEDKKTNKQKLPGTRFEVTTEGRLTKAGDLKKYALDAQPKPSLFVSARQIGLRTTDGGSHYFLNDMLKSH